jgi:hypothetical protein
MPSGLGRRIRAPTVNRRRPMSDPDGTAAGVIAAAAYHREAGYLQPLIVPGDCHTKYLELLNVPAPLASRHQIIGSLAAARMARAGGDSPALPPRAQYTALVGEDSPGPSLGAGLERCWNDGDDDGVIDNVLKPSTDAMAKRSAWDRVAGGQGSSGGTVSQAERTLTSPVEDCVRSSAVCSTASTRNEFGSR